MDGMIQLVFFICFPSVIGMPKEKYDPPDPRRMYTIMSSEEAANGKKSYWAELEISGKYWDAVSLRLDTFDAVLLHMISLHTSVLIIF